VGNGKTSELEIAEEFTKYFATVSNGNSVARSTALMNEYNERKLVYNCDDNLTLVLSNCRASSLSISKLKFGKSPGVDKLTLEYIRHCHPIVATLLTKLFNLMLIFEYILDGFRLSIVELLPKSESNKEKSENYRGMMSV